MSQTHTYRLDDASQTATSFKMADICFYGAASRYHVRLFADWGCIGADVHIEGIFCRTTRPKNPTYGFHLYRVTNRRSSSYSQSLA